MVTPLLLGSGFHYNPLFYLGNNGKAFTRTNMRFNLKCNIYYLKMCLFSMGSEQTQH